MGPLTDAVLFTDDTGLRTRKVPVDLTADSRVTLRLFTVPVLAGDILRIDGAADFTNDVGRDPDKGLKRFTCGIGLSIWWYNASGPAELRAATWKQLDTRGMNCTVDLHHLALSLFKSFTIPDSWVPGHSIGVVLQADAHSTAWKANGGGESITVENHGALEAIRYRPIAPPADG
jgi:hypothetical protein